MKLSTLIFNPFRENTYIIWDDSGECIILDAGCVSEREQERLADIIYKVGLRPVLAVNTHGHFDHLGGVEFVKRTFGIPWAISSDDDYLVKLAPYQAEMYGINMDSVPTAEIDLKERTEISFGTTRLEIIPTPGHTPGHLCFFEPTQKILFTGDLLFKGSIGRTDLTGGDYDTLMSSLRERILPLPPETRVLAGHGYETTLAHEAMYNPFITEVINNYEL